MSKNSDATASVDDGWRYCSVCRRNHEEGRKHIFTKKHLSKLKVVMGKFSKKVRSARRCLIRPAVLDGELEPGVKVWCYCCQEEVNKHITDGHVSVEWGGLIEHMAKPDHHKKTRHYWWENGAETKQLQTFLLFPAEYRQYKELVSKALEDLDKQRDDRMKKLAADLRAVEQQQAITALEPPISLSAPIHLTAGRISRSELHVGHSSIHQYAACPPSHPLSTVNRQGAQSGRGNIHTGATPPWLREDEEEEESAKVIGPSVEEFIKHRERLKRAGKNPKRVGADFHLKLALQKRRGEEDDDNWLPSFGRVWNPGPRSHTQTEFRRELAQENKKHKLQPPSTISPATQSTPSPATQSIPTPVTQPTLSHTHQNHPAISLAQSLSRTFCTDTSEAGTSQSSRPYLKEKLISSQDEPLNSASELSLDGETEVNELVIKPYTRKRKICKTLNSTSN